MSNKPLNVGLVGGGKGAFIVNPHQKAIHFDGTRRVTAGALFPDGAALHRDGAPVPFQFDRIVTNRDGSIRNAYGSASQSSHGNRTGDRITTDHIHTACSIRRAGFLS